MQLEDNILKDLKELWPNDWEKLIDFWEKKEAAFPENAKEKLGPDYFKNQIIERIEGRKALLAREQEIVNAIIPKEDLEDGVVYLAMEGTEHFCRYVQEARWDAAKGYFWFIRNKFGHTFEDQMDHFADVVHGSVAGFTPIRKKDG